MSVMVTTMFPVVPGQRAPVPQWSQEEEEGGEEEEDMTVKGEVLPEFVPILRRVTSLCSFAVW